VPDSNRKKIWLTIEAGLKTITQLDTVYFGMPPLDEIRVIGIIPMLDPHERLSKVGNKEQSLQFALRYQGEKGTVHALYQYEDLAPVIKAKMDELRNTHRLGGAGEKLWRDLILQSEKWLYPDSEHPETGVDLNYVVEYAP
jgi:hypothetical protein